MSLAFFYLGLDGIYGRFRIERGPISVALGVGLMLAALGWLDPIPAERIRGYLVIAGLLGTWWMVSAVASWDSSAMYLSATGLAWLVFIVPGLASLLRVDQNRNAMLLGLATGVSIYVFTAVFRLATGRGVLDEVSGAARDLLTVNRNGVNGRVVFVTGLLVFATGPKLLRRTRWLVVGASVIWLVNSGGRSGLLGLAVVLLAYGLLQPGASARVRTLLAMSMIGVIAFGWIQSSTGQASESTNRLMTLLRGERDDSDESRVLVLRKAWHLAIEHPAFGVGNGNFETTYHPVVEEARNVRIRNAALELPEHNTYTQILSETGFPGLALFVAMIAWLVLAGASASRNAFARAATCSLAGVAFVMFFHSALGLRLYYSAAFVLTGVAIVRRGAPDDGPAG
jgi:O-antigen ligase